MKEYLVMNEIYLENELENAVNSLQLFAVEALVDANLDNNDAEALKAATAFEELTKYITSWKQLKNFCKRYNVEFEIL